MRLSGQPNTTAGDGGWEVRRPWRLPEARLRPELPTGFSRGRATRRSSTTERLTRIVQTTCLSLRLVITGHTETSTVNRLTAVCKSGSIAIVAGCLPPRPAEFYSAQRFADGS